MRDRIVELYGSLARFMAHGLFFNASSLIVVTSVVHWVLIILGLDASELVFVPSIVDWVLYCSTFVPVPFFDVFDIFDVRGPIDGRCCDRSCCALSAWCGLSKVAHLAHLRKIINYYIICIVHASGQIYLYSFSVHDLY